MMMKEIRQEDAEKSARNDILDYLKNVGSLSLTPWSIMFDDTELPPLVVGDTNIPNGKSLCASFAHILYSRPLNGINIPQLRFVHYNIMMELIKNKEVNSTMTYEEIQMQLALGTFNMGTIIIITKL